MRSSVHLDRRLALAPRDYVAEPARFGRDLRVERVMPAGGDPASAHAAWAQHQLVCEWRARGQRPPVAALARRFGFSKQTWSRTVSGERWAGQLLLTALMHAVETVPSQTAPNRTTKPDGVARGSASP